MPKLKDREPLKRYDFRISEADLDILLTTLNLPKEKGNYAVAIHIAIDRVITHGKCFKENFASYTDIRAIPSSSKTKLFYFRENPDKINFLRYFYRLKAKDDYTYFNCILPSASKVIRAAIYDVCNDTLSTFDKKGKKILPAKIKNDEHIFPYPGQKNNKMLTALNSIFMEIVSSIKIESYYEPFMGSANVFLHLPPELGITNFFLNDLDINVFSLIKTVQSDLLLFNTTIFKMPYNKMEFDFISQCLYPRTKENNSIPLTSLQRAVYLFYLNCCAFIQSKETIDIKYSYNDYLEYTSKDFAFSVSQNFYSPSDNGRYIVPDNHSGKLKLLRHLRSLGKLSDKLKCAYLYNSDYEAFINEHLEDKCGLYYIDSPYFFSEDVYALHTFDHRRLADTIDRIHTSGNYFVASNRVTVSNSNKHTNKDAIEKVNELYKKDYYHYMLLLFKKCRRITACQVEIIISNFPFSGSKPFNHDITEEEVNDFILQENTLYD